MPVLQRDGDLSISFPRYERDTSGLDFIENLVYPVVDHRPPSRTRTDKITRTGILAPTKEKLLRNASAFSAGERADCMRTDELIVTSPVNMNRPKCGMA